MPLGLRVRIQEKEKTKESTIRSAFLKGNTKEHLLLFYADENLAGSVARSEVVKIKFEGRHQSAGVCRF